GSRRALYAHRPRPGDPRGKFRARAEFELGRRLKAAPVAWAQGWHIKMQENARRYVLRCARLVVCGFPRSPPALPRWRRLAPACHGDPSELEPDARHP